MSVPVMGIAHVTVTAGSEHEALDKALDIADSNDVDEWYTLRQVVEGNIFHGPLNRIRVDNVYDPEAE